MAISTGSSSPPFVQVRLQEASSWGPPQRFIANFRIGRSPECDLALPVPAVSKVHAEVQFQDGRWWLIDLQSRNGTYLNGERIDRAPLPTSCKVELGQGGAILWIGLGEEASAPERSSENTYLQEAPESVTQLVKRLEGFNDTQEGGAQTRIYSEALKRITKRRSQRYHIILGITGLVLAGVVALAIHQYLKIERLRNTAGEIFYSMKRVELQVAQLEELIKESAQAKELQDLLAKRQEIKNLESKYDKFIKELGIYDPNMSEQERAVFRVARLFGECEATMPKDFLAEVNKYIKKWKSTERLALGMRRALAAGYTGTVSNEMFINNLPPHFFYLALQESGFDPKAIGPKTRVGYAKGMWQFVPTTAKDFGLRPGPYFNEPRFDPDDDRFNPIMATKAAAKYIKRIYLTDAQASGLLVIASYNWGEGNVVRKIRQMPLNPQERNFWKLLKLKDFKIPQETYDYVFYIISAAVIGENPQLFGFNFPPPFPNTRTL
jgi:hypothetical protein